MERLAMNLSASELNNTAIAYWLAGYPHESTELFHIAIANLRDQCQMEVDEDTTLNMSGIDKVPDVVAGCRDAVTMMPSCLISSCHGMPIDMTQEDCFLLCYNQAIILDATTIYDDDSLLPAAIMFNMALLQHSKGLECANDGMLVQASRMYKLSVGLWKGQNKPGSNTLLYMALLNNIAHIDSHFQRRDQMMASLGNMRHILALENDTSACDSSLDDDSYMIFSLNVAVGETIDFLIAPAA